MSVDRAKIAARLKDARKGAGLTQQEVADRFQVHLNTVQLWENGARNKRTGEHEWSVPWDRLPELAELYGVKLNWLQNDDEPVAPTQVEVQADRLAEAIEKLVVVLARLDERLTG